MERASLQIIGINLAVYGSLFFGTLGGLFIAPLLYAYFRATTNYSSQEIARKLIWIYGRCWVWVVSRCVPVTLPKETLPKSCVIVVNHASFFDVYFMGGQPNWNSSIAVRQWPFKIPFYKPFMDAAGYVRTEDSTPDAVVDDAVTILHSGASMIFFPEGTRSRDAQLQRFYSGAFKTAVEANVPVVPLCLSGTGSFLPRGSWRLRPAHITVSLLPPVYPANYSETANPHVSLRKDVKASMQAHIKSLQQ